MPDSTKPMFRTPEEVTQELGMTKTELRRYCKESGIYTRLSKNRIMLDAENIAGIVAWVKAKSAEPVYLPDGAIDPFG